MDKYIGAKILVFGIVQGVGFRPFLYNLARQFELSGWVKNTSANVEIRIEGSPSSIQAFTKHVRESAPSLAHITKAEYSECELAGYDKFEILDSEPIPNAYQPISPDIGVCADCLRELFDPSDRRYRYPFINCTNCGPRFTIIQDIPYDRPNTTMAGFTLCDECSSEYSNPENRRFHAQPVACPRCGPQVWLEWSKNYPNQNGNIDRVMGEQAITLAQELLIDGKIIAIKGLGGFHLACDATNRKAVNELRNRKMRVDKPFAVMMRDLAIIRQACDVNDVEQAALESYSRPIVILRRRPDANIVHEIAPGQATIGTMLPYTPLHYLLYASEPTGYLPQKDVPIALVMTSGNLSEEPIVTTNDSARESLSALADAFLFNDRPIYTRCDDSVIRVFSSSPKKVSQIRRSRGYAPFPFFLPNDVPAALGTGAELKNTFCLTRGNHAFLSHHIGDLENYETLQSFEGSIAHYEKLFRIKPELIAYDLHPDYLSSQYAIDRCNREGLPSLAIQHHHAHIAACMVENSLPGDEPVIGVAFDGTGYGDDGAIWGGEFLVADFRSYRRAAHFTYYPLPGGDSAIRRPSKIALAYLWQAGVDWDPLLTSVTDFSIEERLALQTQLERHFNTPSTSSVGRLFDAIAALTGVRQKINYEAQAAIEFETIYDPSETGFYEFSYLPVRSTLDISVTSIDPAPVIRSVIEDSFSGMPIGRISAKFHNGIARTVLYIAKSLREETGIRQVVLSGGVWQNLTLLNYTYHLLLSEQFDVFIHHQIPTNDGGISIGQAVIAINHFTSGA